MKCLTLSSIVFILALCSCTVSRYSEYEFVRVPDDSVDYKAIFPDSVKTVKFKSEINIYKNYLTGLLVVKKESDSSFHTILLTEMGIKLFDLNVKKNSYDINFAIEQINRKDLFDLISSDIRMIFIDYLRNSEKWIYSENKSGLKIIRVNNNQTWLYNYLDVRNKSIRSIESASGKNPEIILNIEYDSNLYPETISIKHSDFDIELGLEVLKDEQE